MSVQDITRRKESRSERGTPLTLLQTPRIESLAERSRKTAEVAALHAEAVDREARFPAEAIAAARANGLMGVMSPRSLGGEGANLSEVADVCFTLARACASTAMIYAMHQVKVACVVRHGLGVRWHQAFLRRLARDQLLVASSTTEGQKGGDVRSSEAPIEREGERIALERAASVISYGAEADAIVTTARRAPDAAASDQVLAVFLSDDYTLERTSGWDTLGMRGTCSAGFSLRARGEAAQLLPVPYEAIHAQTMTPAAHILWASVWAGVAAEAVEKARRHLRKSLRASGGEPPLSMPHFNKASAALRKLRALIAAALRRYEALRDDPDALTALDFQSEIALLKVDASELAVEAVLAAMRCGGLTAYRNDTEASLGRSLRDILSAPIMIANDRILANLGASALLTEAAASARG